MRSVVVVLPASMCAMMPILRTLLRSVSTSCATGCRPYVSGGMRGVGLPAVVRECSVGLRHLVRVLAALDRSTETVRRVEDLVRETLGHRLLTTTLRVAHEPAQREGVRAVRLDLDRDLVGRAADAAGL